MLLAPSLALFCQIYYFRYCMLELRQKPFLSIDQDASICKYDICFCGLILNFPLALKGICPVGFSFSHVRYREVMISSFIYLFAFDDIFSVFIWLRLSFFIRFDSTVRKLQKNDLSWEFRIEAYRIQIFGHLEWILGKGFYYYNGEFSFEKDSSRNNFVYSRFFMICLVFLYA